jgi:DNA-binding response OmpR family regulator
MSLKHTVLAVCHTRKNLQLLTQMLEAAGYNTIQAGELEELDRILQHTGDVHAALIDVGGFDKTIWNRCEALREMEIPFLMLSSRQSDQVQEQSMQRGAHGLVIKPVAVKKLLSFLHTMLRR